MAKLPALPTWDEAKTALLETDAITHSRANIRMIRDEKIAWGPLKLSWFEKSDGHRWGKMWLKIIAAEPSGDGLVNIAELARAGWGLAHEAMCDMIREHLHNNKQMSPTLAAYSILISDPQYRCRRTGGKQLADFLLRDIAILFCVGDVCWKFGIPPTRQLLSKREGLSGCKVVARAMADEKIKGSLTEPNIVRVWTRYHHLAFPRGIKALGPYPDRL